MNYHHTIPTLSLTSMAAWAMAMHCEAEALVKTQQVRDLEYIPYSYVHWSAPSIKSSFITSIPLETEDYTITPVMHINPAGIITQIQLHHLTE